MGKGLTRLYADFFHFPFLIFRHDADVYAIAGLVSVFAAVAGALKAVREVLALAPAVAMQPPAAAALPQAVQQPAGAQSTLFSQLTIMALRHIVRRPLRAGATVARHRHGLGLLVTALLSFDSVELHDRRRLLPDRPAAGDAQLHRREARTRPAVGRAHAGRAARRALPVGGRAPAQRPPVAAAVHHRQAQGHGPLPRPRSRLPADRRCRAAGLVINERVAQILHLRRGDVVEVDVPRGAARRARHMPVADVIKSYFGLTAFMDIDALDQLMYGPRLTGVHIAYDTRHQDELFTAIKSTPGIGSIALQRHALTRFRETIAQNINYSVTIYVTLAVIIAFGVVYNSARIQLSEHARELASLRVLGFTRGRGLARAAHRARAAHAGCDPSWAGSSATASAGC